MDMKPNALMTGAVLSVVVVAGPTEENRLHETLKRAGEPIIAKLAGIHPDAGLYSVDKAIVTVWIKPSNMAITTRGA